MKERPARHQHLRLLGPGEAPEEKSLDHPADRGDEQRRDQCRQPEIEMKPHDEARAEIGAEHEERAMRQIGNPHQPEDQRESRREEEEQTAEGDAVDGKDQPQIHGRCAAAGLSGRC